MSGNHSRQKRERNVRPTLAVVSQDLNPTEQPTPERKPTVSCPASWTAEFCAEQVQSTSDSDEATIKMWDARRRTLVMYNHLKESGKPSAHPFAGLVVDEHGRAKEVSVLLTTKDRLSSLGLET